MTPGAELNKYNLTPADIERLGVDRVLVNEAHGFWRNSIIKAWCLDESTSGHPGAPSKWSDMEYWLGIYDAPNPDGSVKIRLMFSAYEGVRSYRITEFFKADEINTPEEYEIQRLFIKKINQLIEQGVFRLKPPDERDDGGERTEKVSFRAASGLHRGHARATP